MSNGGQMSIRLACSLSSRIAAIAPVAGAYYPPFRPVDPPGPWQNSAETCPDTRPVPIIAFHGTDDATVPFEGGPNRPDIDNTTPDDDVMQLWAAHNGCTSGRQESPISSEVRLVTYTGCDDDADALLYIVDGGGHTWPGSPYEIPELGYTTQEISATDLMLEFFEAHPMPGAPEPKPTPQPSPGDSDGDGCPDADESGSDEMLGGQRSYLNPWDYFNPTNDGQNRVDDILAVVNQYFEDEFLPSPPDPPDTPNPNYDKKYDRTSIPGVTTEEPWRLGPPNWQQRVDDILHAVNSYFHDCPTA
jgi:hypothetical protein